MAAAVLAAAFLFGRFLLPGTRLDLQQAAWQSKRPTALGVFHVHTQHSDGSGTSEEVAAAAARAGLNFVVFTDHGDGTRLPDPPQYRSGVLCIDAVEISSSRGHYVALGLPQTPYPLGGDPRDVVEDVARLGGFGIVAHPDSSKPTLQWHEWTASFEGLEWLNADSEWRDESAGGLARALATYPFRPSETIGALLRRPDTTFLRWDALTQRRRVVALAGADAHARLGWRDDDTQGYRRSWFLRIPSYESSFRAFALRVNLAERFSGNATEDAAQFLDAIRAGHVYTGIDDVASPAALEFSARSGRATAEQGDLLEAGAPVTLVARVNATTGGVIALRKDGKLVTQHSVPELRFDAPAGPGVYRVEAYLSNARGQPSIPWIVSNPIYVEPAGWGQPMVRPRAPVTDSWGIQGGPWHVEQGNGSTGSVTAHEPPNGPIEFNYRLAGGPRAGQYSALVLSAGNALTGHTDLAFQAHASGPMRISVQARRPAGAAGERWQRSVYLDQTPRDIYVRFNDMTPVGATSRPILDPPQIDTLLFVVDTTNTAPGAQGTFELSRVRVEH